jgi:hypothetical protein
VLYFIKLNTLTVNVQIIPAMHEYSLNKKLNIEADPQTQQRNYHPEKFVIDCKISRKD